ncbi:hypothetical protein [Herbaspirillum sp.]|uniref:hypothetical protein n=1 Tax=Herbaspirillum sp. TaxID=1890675 RepID=UPI0031CDF757
MGIESDSDEPDSVEGKIESSSISARARLVTAAYQLLTNWPQNFLAAADTANLSRHHFGPTWKQQPIWLAETVEQVLSRRTIGITREKVLSVMHSLELDGKQVSKSSLRRALGVTEARAIDAVVSYRRKATLEEFALLCGEYERQLTVTSSARTQKTSLCRDYLILLLSALSGRKVESVCALTERDVRTLFAALHTEVDAKGDQFKATFQRAEEISGDDALWVRAGASQELRFASRFGRNLAGHSLRARIAKDMRNILPAELWNSADAFRGVFTTY